MENIIEQYYNNVGVLNNKNKNEYFSITLTNEKLSICRYCVPGRLDIYSFEYDLNVNIKDIGKNIRFFSDYNLSIIEMIKILKRDLKKSQVNEMIKISLDKNLIYKILKRIIS